MTSTPPDDRLSADNCAVLFVDHQAGLVQVSRDYDQHTFRNNVLALVDIAVAYGLPTVLTTSIEDGPNGPLVPEIKAAFPDAPYIARPGQINAWDNDDFVAAVKATGRKKLVIAGIVTEVCVAFVALSALAAGFEVYVVTDCSGTFSKDTRDAALMRMVQAGAVPMNWFALACELQRDWREGGEKLLQVCMDRLPQYACLVNSTNAAKSGGK